MNPDDVRSRLQADPAWAVYALGDLAPAHAPHCRWFTAPPSAVALLYGEFSTPIFWAAGDPAAFAHHERDLFAATELILQIKPEYEPLIRRHYHRVGLHRMWRMALRPADFAPAAPQPSDRRIELSELPVLQAFYDATPGDGPEFFQPSMLEHGIFYGAWAGGELVAAAGTHVYSVEQRAGAIGCVYTRADQRRRGHAARLTSALARALFNVGVDTVALSVREENVGATSVYARLGFHSHCRFFEGHAWR